MVYIVAQPGSFSGADNGEFIICGIIGIAGEASKANDTVLSTLLILDSLRGIDSTGIAHISRAGETSVAKALGNPFELLGSRQFNKVTTPAARAIIGHNRFATQGAVSKDNAHPFEFEHLVGVHNGTLTNKWELDDAKDFAVDSENLYHHMNKKGLYDLLGVMRGAWSLVWWDKQEEELCFLRNKERPMWTAWSEDYKSLYWASEAWMLNIALSRAGVKHHEAVSNEADKLYAYPIDKEGVVYKPSIVDRPSRSVFFVGSSVLNNGGVAGSTVVNLNKQSAPAAIPADQRKGMVMELLAKASDKHGGEYFICFYPEKPEMNIRLYVNKRSSEDFQEGVGIVCDISDVSYTEWDKGIIKPTTYFKVIESTAVPILSVDAPIEEEETFKDCKGRPLNREDWIGKHGMCDFCTGYVDPNSYHRFTTEGHVLCQDCSKEPSVIGYLQLV